MRARLREFWSRLGALWRRGEADRDFRDELRSHVELGVADEIQRGTHPEEARRLALVRLGGLEVSRALRDETRGFLQAELLWRDLRYAARALRRSPGYSLAIVLILGAGIGATTAVFSVIKHVLLTPLPYVRPTELVALWETNARAGSARDFVAGANVLDWRENAVTLHDVAAVSTWNGNLTGLAEPQHVGVAYATSSLWTVLGVYPATGRLFAATDPDEPLNGTRTAVIGYRLWQQGFGGDAAVVGRVIAVNYRSFRIVGVAPKGFRFPNAGTEIWVREDLRSESREYHHLSVVARLRPNVGINRAQGELDAIAAVLERSFPATNTGRGVEVVPLDAERQGRVARSLVLLQAAVALVCLIACVNAANLMTCRGQTRAREYAVRRALGVSRRGLVQALLAEGFVLTVAAGSLGVLLSWGGTALVEPHLLDVLPAAEGLAPDWIVLGFALSASLVVGLLCSLAPLRASLRADPLSALKAGGPAFAGTASQSLWQRGLVVVQIALSTVLLLSGGVLLRSLIHLQRVDLGFDPAGVLTADFSLPAAKYTPAAFLRFYEDLSEGLGAIPGVTSVSVVSPLPLAGANDLVEVRDLSTETRLTHAASLRVVGANFFKTLRIPLRAGREIAREDRPGAPAVAVVSQSLAKQLWPASQAVGRRVRIDGTSYDVIGVVGDIRGAAAETPPIPTVYLSLGQAFRAFPTVVVRTTTSSAEAVTIVKEAMRAADRDVPLFHVRDLSDVFASTLSSRRLATSLLVLLACFATGLAGAGVFALLSFIVALRNRDTAIRVALGARRGHILSAVLREGMTLVVFGLVSGLLLAMASIRTLNNWVFGTTPTDPLTFGGVSLAVTILGLAACYIPARRALLADPIRNLRAD